MKKAFLTNLAIVLGLNLTIKPLWIFIIDRNVQNQVGLAEFGTYFSLFNFSYLFYIILDLGLTGFNNRNIAQNSHLLSKHFSRMVMLKLTLAVVYLAVCCAIGFIIKYDARHMKLLMILCFNQFLISFILYLRSNISGMHFFKTDSLISVTDRLIGIAICAPIIWWHFLGGIDIMNYVYAQTASYLFTAIIAFSIVVNKAGFIKFDWGRTFSIMILKQSFPFAILGALMIFFNRIDSVMLERMLNDNGVEAGVYAQAFRLLDAANMVSVLSAGLLLPMFARMLKYKESVESLVKVSYTMFMALAIMVAAGCFFYGENIMHMLYTGDVTESTRVFQVLMCCFMGTATQYIFSTLLTANGNLKQLNIIAGFGMAINIGVNFIVIPHFHAIGSACVSLSTQLFVALIQMVVVQKIFKFDMLFKLLATLAIFAIGVIGINYLSLKLPYDWRVSFILMCGASGIFAFAIGLLNVKGFLNVMKNG
jgi:O-antigen/teichoic acid export membrane protein